MPVYQKGIESDQESIVQLQQDIEGIKETENLSDNGKAFILWILTNYFDVDKENAVTKLIDSPNDKRVDAFIEEDDTINILQCKFFQDPSKEVSGKDIVLFKGCIDWLNNPEQVKKLNIDRLYDAALTFFERWTGGVDIQLHFFAFGKFSSEADQERIVFNNSDLRDKIQAKYRREEFNRLMKEPNLFTDEEISDIHKKEFLIYSNLIILYFIGRFIQKRYRQYSPAIAGKLLNQQLEERMMRIFDYIAGILKFSEKLKQETNLPRFLKNIDNIKFLYEEIQKAVEMESARTRKDPLKDMLPEM